MSGRERKILGRWGEAAAADYLRKKGFRLVAAGWHCRFGEVDLIVEDGDYLVFVEVKMRRSASFAQAREFVDVRKQNKLRTTAQMYLSMNPTSLQPRFDVVEVYAPQGTQTIKPSIHHLENAFI